MKRRLLCNDNLMQYRKRSISLVLMPEKALTDATDLKKKTKQKHLTQAGGARLNDNNLQQ